MVREAGGNSRGRVYECSRRLERLTTLRDECIEAIERMDREIAVRRGVASSAYELGVLEAKRAEAQSALCRVAESIEGARDELTDLRVRLGQEYRREGRENAVAGWVRAAWFLIIGLVVVILWNIGR